MNKKNTYTILFSCLAILILLLIILLGMHVRKNKNADSQSNGATEITENFDIHPETEENAIPTVVNTEPSVSVNDVSTQPLSIFLNSIIDDSYKTDSYACDIITQESMASNVISIQLESDDFSDEASCIAAAKSIIEQTISSEYADQIQAFDFSFMVSSQVRYIMLVNDISNITSADMIEDHMKIQEF